MYASIKHHSSNDKDLVYHVYYNDVMFELHGIEINGTYYNVLSMTEKRQVCLYYYMVSRIIVWKAIRSFEGEMITY
jgi:hypothetical protein